MQSFTIPITKRLDMSENAVLNILKAIYGQQAFQYVIICLTKADMLESNKIQMVKNSFESLITQSIGFKVPICVVSKNDPSSMVQVYNEIANIVETRPNAFQPPQVSEKQIHEAVGAVSKSMDIDYDKLFQAIITIIPFIASGGCNLL